MPEKPQHQSTAGLPANPTIAEQIIAHLPLAVITFDRNFDTITTNPAAQEMFGPCENILEILQSCSTSDEATDWQSLLEDTLDQDKSKSYDEIRYSNSKRTRILRMICTPLEQQLKNDVARGALAFQDITAGVTMQTDLADAERLASVGKLAARVAHELNNPLDGILRYINLAIRIADQQQLEQIDRYLKQSRVGLQRMVHIIGELLEFSRSTYSAAAEADINKIVEEAVKTLEAQAVNNNVEIIRNYASAMPNIRSGNMFQVFCNLIKNAIDAMVEHCPPTQQRQLTITTLCTSNDAVIDFCDTGMGLNDEVREKLFEPFFTTKAPGKGTGLGLAICKDIIEKYNGQITAQNHPQGGAKFTVTIPLLCTSFRTE
ncbi:MAG: GHKL domain-containing protein [Sedimentisphaerales bacterium]|nr:GHKL domain-containing protein [Sedimentisphaerales bacterium]